jgi:hypothetical protein
MLTEDDHLIRIYARVDRECFPMAEELFKDGKVSGSAGTNTGNLVDEGRYDAGRKAGEWVTYAPDGTEYQRKTFKWPDALSLPATKPPTLSHFLRQKFKRSLTR